ncbi:MAG: hypothetical protein LBU32_00435 [Clostridiales bacterium]|nr:hypothetical protein [Clostridiales bacterium]
MFEMIDMSCVLSVIRRCLLNCRSASPPQSPQAVGGRKAVHVRDGVLVEVLRGAHSAGRSQFSILCMSSKDG